MDFAPSEPLLDSSPAKGHGETQASFMAVTDPFVRSSVGLQRARSVSGDETDWRKWNSWQSWGSAFSAALPLFLLNYSTCVSYAHLIISGASAIPIRAAAITGMHVFSCGLTGIILPLKSKCPLIVSSADISVTIFYQQVVNEIVKGAASQGLLSPQEVAATVLLALPLNTLLMSLVFYLVGKNRGTVVMSYLPYPVVAGFLGSIGLAIFLGSFAVLADGVQPTLQGIMQLCRERGRQVGCAAAMALGALFLRSAGLPARVLAVLPTAACMILFWLVVLVFGHEVKDLREDGWLFPAADFEPFWSIWAVQQPQLVSLSLLAPKASTFLGLGLVLVLSLTLRVAGIEGSTGYSMVIDDEVKWTGLASAGAGLCGTVIGSHSPGLTTFNLEAGSSNAHASVLTAVMMLALWLSGFPVMNLFPRFLLSGILMNLGLVMLQEWMWTARRKVGKLGLLVIYAQVASSGLLGLLPSVLVGASVALLTAQAQLMKLHVLKYHVSGQSVTANVCRSAEQRELLKANRAAIECLGLEGFLSEGPMIKLSHYVRQYVEHNDHVRFLVFDMQACQGCNVSACSLLAKLDKVLQNHRIEAFYSNLESEMSGTLRSFGISSERIFDVDSKTATSFLLALEHCENSVLDRALGHCQAASEITFASVEEGDLQLALQKFLNITEDQARKLSSAGSWCQKPLDYALTVQGRLDDTLHIAVPGHSEVTEFVDAGASHAPAHKVAVNRHGSVCGVESVLYDEVARSTLRVTLGGSRFLAVKKTAVHELLSSDPSLSNCIGRIATRQFMRHADALLQALQLNEGGGWRGGHFDTQTAQVCAHMLHHPAADDSKNQEVAFSRLQSPTFVKKRKFLNRKSTIDAWAQDWWRQRTGD
eukprot:TRINITY_DN105638_c0_g1_i1.p1 TRINITY_DN105638_c0_g1~~TRINITY_DN105638_c0_g1_i1.p1  ORF type:complete len:882 (+),score=153.52 TRINITY_DN105638_c0_g1_i1:24-2648(+)